MYVSFFFLLLMAFLKLNNRCWCVSSIKFNSFFVSPFLDFISFRSLTKENEVAAGAWQAIMSAGGSQLLDHFWALVMAGSLPLSLRTAAKVEDFWSTSVHIRWLVGGMDGQWQVSPSRYLEIKPLSQQGIFLSHYGKTTLRILHLIVTFSVQQLGLVSLVLEFLVEDASQELLTQTVLSLFCQINHGALRTRHRVMEWVT